MDSFEEERDACFVKPINAMVTIIDQVKAELLAARDHSSPTQTRKLYHDAMELLFETLALGKPVAIRKSEGKSHGFCWKEWRESGERRAYWVTWALIRNSDSASKSLDLRRSCKDLRRESRITYQSRVTCAEDGTWTQGNAVGEGR